jgi:hypothetical protein
MLTPWGTIAYFKLNREYIAKVLCENRDKPQMHCNGKCYLAKRLKQQQEKQDKETSEKVQNTPVIQLFAPAVFAYIFEAPVFIQSKKKAFFHQLSLYSAPATSLLRPPKKMIS